jgi:hypothetical protein
VRAFLEKYPITNFPLSGMTSGTVEPTQEAEPHPKDAALGPKAGAPAVESKPKEEPKPAKVKPSVDELQITLLEKVAAHGVPPSFRDANKKRLEQLTTGKASEVQFARGIFKDAEFLRQWIRWALCVYAKLPAPAEPTE